MAQRKNTPSPGTKRPATAKPGARPAGSSARTASSPGRPPARKPGKSIVNQRQTPWGLLITTVLIVAFAGAVIGVVIATHKSTPNAQAGGIHSVNAADPYRQAELADAKQIKGLTYTVEGQHKHVPGAITYDHTPPVGGNHSQYWADCTGTVYAQPIANENAVHMLEHGAIWITYNPKTLPAAQLTKLKTYVAGVDRMALSPYPGLKAPISLQAWGYQLFVNKANDPRIAQFIGLLKYNKATTPEYGATCSQPTFKQHPSTFGHPLWVPANGASGNTMGK